ncbi:hypothetical protein G5V57_04720 [Nordella sp. HKS 07]|uniref:hypothetical protein n=1 Tax=Nordella sp. HKS 07 TaxID=2712222 RepID=UPI0013E12EEE|nr:hypothetical protein [Nordella sp. HKS 07]QIG47104.1 hypothetical protein G5V57_04720 [Nordella sp. HKS 07]
MSWSRWIDPCRLAGAAALLFILANPVAAEDTAACGKFKWPLSVEKSWFDAVSDLKAYASGAAVSQLSEGALTLALRPMAEITFALPPEGKPKPDKTLGALLNFTKVTKPGRYQVTLSDEAWIDIVQAGAYRPSGEFSGVRDCPDLRKSVRFEFTDAPLILQLSGASAPTIKVAIRKVE